MRLPSGSNQALRGLPGSSLCCDAISSRKVTGVTVDASHTSTCFRVLSLLARVRVHQRARLRLDEDTAYIGSYTRPTKYPSHVSSFRPSQRSLQIPLTECDRGPCTNGSRQVPVDYQVPRPVQAFQVGGCPLQGLPQWSVPSVQRSAALPRTHGSASRRKKGTPPRSQLPTSRLSSDASRCPVLVPLFP